MNTEIKVYHYKNLSLDDIEGEIWKDFDLIKGYYLISSKGRVKSILNRCGSGIRIMKQNAESSGYLSVPISAGAIKKLFSVHRLVALAFHENPENKPLAHHKDHDKLNNESDNIMWATYSENSKKAWDAGMLKIKSGENNGMASFTNEQVLHIFNSPLSGVELGKIYGRNKTVINDIKSGRRWSSLTGKKAEKKYSHMTAERILEIFNESGTLTELAKKYSVTKSTIFQIKNKRRWKDILATV